MKKDYYFASLGISIIIACIVAAVIDMVWGQSRWQDAGWAVLVLGILGITTYFGHRVINYWSNDGKEE